MMFVWFLRQKQAQVLFKDPETVVVIMFELDVEEVAGVVSVITEVEVTSVVASVVTSVVACVVTSVVVSVVTSVVTPVVTFVVTSVVISFVVLSWVVEATCN